MYVLLSLTLKSNFLVKYLLAYFTIHRSSSMYVPFKLVWQICKRISRIQEPLFGLHSILRIMYICSPAWNFRSMFFHEKTFTNWIIEIWLFFLKTCQLSPLSLALNFNSNFSDTESIWKNKKILKSSNSQRFVDKVELTTPVSSITKAYYCPLATF